MRMHNYILILTSVLILFSACSTKNNRDYQLKTSVSPSDAGTVSPESGYFNDGDSLEITATPNEQWVFDQWKGDFTGSENPAKLEVNKDLDITAMFTERTYPLNLEIQGKGIVSEQVIQQKTNEYPEGTVVELTADPDEDWTFSKWSGDISGSDPRQEITITGETEVTAIFTNDFVKTFGGSDSDRAYSSAYTNDDGLVLTGVSSSDDGDFSGLKKSENFLYVMKLTNTGEIEWVKTFTGSEHAEGATSIIQTTDGGFALTGYTRSNSGEFSNTNRGREDIFVIKLTPNGDTEWIKTFGGSYNDHGRIITETKNGNLIVAGDTSSLDGDFEGLQKGLVDGFLIKLNSVGETQWVKTFGGSESDYIFSIASTDDGIVFTGFTESEDGDIPGSIQDLSDAYIMKTDFKGTLQWVRKFGGNHDDTPLSIISSASGNIIVTGTTFSYTGDFTSPDNGFQKPFVIKLDPSGNIEWLNVYDGDTSMIRGRSVVETQTGDFLIAAYSNSNTKIYHPQIQVDTRILVMKINSSGTLQWMKTFEGSNDDNAYTITKSDHNTFYITGDSNSTDGFFSGLNIGLNDIFVIQLDASGELVAFD